jgi:hypothetical protein
MCVAVHAQSPGMCTRAPAAGERAALAVAAGMIGRLAGRDGPVGRLAGWLLWFSCSCSNHLLVCTCKGKQHKQSNKVRSELACTASASKQPSPVYIHSVAVTCNNAAAAAIASVHRVLQDSLSFVLQDSLSTAL